jgi:dihydrofolate synthase/folylpolyglutamate synthase
MSAVLHAFSKRPKFGTGPGIPRSRRLLEILGVTPSSTIGVTGSNGKGSTAAMAASLLTAAGLRTGLFTSPHFLCPTERYRIDGAPVAFDALEAALSKVLEGADMASRERGEVFSRFELLTAAGWLLFEQQRVDALVMEVGIGGRHCPTKLGVPPITALASLDLEHTEILGNSLEEIACDKIELTPRGGTCFAAFPPDVGLRENVRLHAEEHGITLVSLEAEWPELRGDTKTQGHLFGRMSSGVPIEAAIPLKGDWQVKNAALAITCAYAALSRMGREVPKEEINAWVSRGFAKVQVPGRFEKVNEDPEIIVDAAHTPDALRQVASFIKENWELGIVLCGISSSKPVREMAKVLSTLPFEFFVSSAEHGGAVPREIAAVLEANAAAVIEVDSDLKKLLANAKEAASQKKVPLFVLGGLFFAAEVCHLLKGSDEGTWLYL